MVPLLRQVKTTILEKVDRGSKALGFLFTDQNNKTTIVMTKEELLLDSGFDFESFQLEHEYSAKSILIAMQRYANQESNKEIMEQRQFRCEAKICTCLKDYGSIKYSCVHYK